MTPTAIGNRPLESRRIESRDGVFLSDQTPILWSGQKGSLPPRISDSKMNLEEDNSITAEIRCKEISPGVVRGI